MIATLEQQLQALSAPEDPAELDAVSDVYED
jgi:hypothetical protein